VDPKTWIIQQNTVTGIDEFVTKGDLFVQKVQTIGRVINLKLSVPGLIKVYDIAGRQVYQAHAAELHYKPTSAGKYHIMVGEEKFRVVVVK
jgi:hypothetical protein